MKTNTILTILQQSEYDLKYFNRWYQTHKNEDLDLKPKKWTFKLIIIFCLYSLFFFLPISSRIKISLSIFKPFEYLVRKVIYFLAQLKLLLFKLFGLKVVAIAGSYAKTSTKHIIKGTLGKQINTLVTPKSINTPLGIANVILKNLKPNHKLFVVEFGEYVPGEIRQLCKFTKPDYGILTPIGRQHLERMGSMENIVKTFSELLEYFKFDKNKLILAEENHQYYKSKDFDYYGKSKNILHSKVTRSGTEFAIKHDDKELNVFSPLYGEHQAANALPSFWLAEKLNSDLQKIAKSLASISYIPHRHQPFFADDDVLILDNSYNSNPDSVNASLELINQLNPTHRIMITPGFVELGKNAKEIHYQFGQKLAKEIDYLGLLDFPNQADIIAGFKKAGGKPNRIYTGKTQEKILEKLKDKIIKGSVIVFENGINDIYR